MPPQPLPRAVKLEGGHRVDDLMPLHFVSSVRSVQMVVTSASGDLSVLSLSASGVMLGGLGRRRLRRGLLRGTTIAIGDSGLQASARACAAAAAPSSGDAAENLHELPIAVGVLLEARAIADSGVGRLASQRWARSALTRAVAARLPMRRQACW